MRNLRNLLTLRKKVHLRVRAMRTQWARNFLRNLSYADLHDCVHTAILLHSDSGYYSEIILLHTWLQYHFTPHVSSYVCMCDPGIDCQIWPLLYKGEAKTASGSETFRGVRSLPWNEWQLVLINWADWSRFKLFPTTRTGSNHKMWIGEPEPRYRFCI